MAAPLDPDRWDEFAHPRPPAAQPAGQPAGQDGRITVRELLSQAAAGQVDLPISAVASLVCQFATMFDGVAEGTDSQFDLLSVEVSETGVARVPAGGWVDSGELVGLLREAVSDHALPASVARLLLATPTPDTGRLIAVLSALGSDDELGAAVRACLSASGGSEHSATPGPSFGSPPQGEPLFATSGGRRSSLASPTATRDQSLADGVVVESGKRRFGPRSARLPILSRLPSRVALSIAGGALGLVAVLAVLSAGASASPAPAQTSPAPAQTSLEAASASPEVPSAPTGEAALTASPVTSAAGSSASVSAPVSWAAYLAELDAKRSTAFATGNQALLDDIARAGSAAATRDRDLLAQLRELGVKAVGMTATIVGVSVARQDSSRAELVVTDELSSYRIVRIATGAEIEVRPPRAAKKWRVTLEPVGGAWRLVDSVELGSGP